MMFDGFGYVARQFFRFVIAALAVICAVMIIWWNLDLNAPVDSRSAAARTRDELSRAQSAHSQVTSLSGSHSQQSGIAAYFQGVTTAIYNAFDRMRTKDRERYSAQDRSLRGFFDVQPRSQRIEARQPQSASTSMTLLPSRGLSTADKAALQNQRSGANVGDATDFSSAAQAVGRSIGNNEPTAPITRTLPPPAAPTKQAAAPRVNAPLPSTIPQSAAAPSNQQSTPQAPASSSFSKLAAPPPMIDLQAPQRPAPQLRGAASPTAAATAEKPSQASTERNDFAAVNAAVAAVEEDYRTFNRALDQARLYLERYPNSMRRQPLIEKIDSLAAIRSRAQEERERIDSSSVLSPVDFTDKEFAVVTACLDGIDKLNTIALVKKAVTIQKNIPAYFMLVDADLVAGKANAAADTSDLRAGMGEKIGRCFPNQNAAGAVKYLFWPDPEAKSVSPLMAKVQDALIYGRN